MTWAVVAGVAWTALVLLLGLFLGRVTAAVDRRDQAARTARATGSRQATAEGSRAAGTQPPTPDGSSPEVRPSPSQPV